MALQKSSPPEFIPILGLDTNADPRNAPPGTLDVAQDCFFKRTDNGGVESRKRFGFTSRPVTLLQGGTIGSGRKLAGFNDEQLLLGSSLYSWDPQSTKWSDNVNSGAVPVCTLDAQPVSATSASVVDGLDVAVGGGYICTVYGQGANKSARVVVQNIVTGDHVLDSALSFSVTSGIVEIRVVALASVFMICASFQGSASLMSKTIAFATPTTVSGEVAVTSGLSASGNPPFWDIMRAGSNDWAMVAYRSTTPSVAVTRWNANQTNGGTGSSAITAANGIGWLTWDCSDGNAYLSTLDSTAGLRLMVAAVSNGAVGSTSTIDASQTLTRIPTGYRSGSTNNFFTQDQSLTLGSTSNAFIWRSTGGAAVIYQRGLGIAGKPFLKAGRYCLPCAYSNNEALNAPAAGVLLDQRGYFFLDVTAVAANTAVVVAKAFFGQAAGYLYTTSRQPSACVDLDANRVIMPLRRQAGDAVIIGSPTGGLDKPRSAFHGILDFSLSASSPMTVAGSTLYLPGGSVKEYDGSTLQEAGFHLIPETPTLTIAAGGYGSGVSAQVGVCICWRYTDGRGQVHRSAPSQAVFGATTGANGVTAVACQTYRLSERATNVVIELYLTAQNGSVFYLAAQAVNDPTVDAVSISGLGAGSPSQTFIVQQPQLYTTDGSLAHEPFPPARLMCVWRGRVFLVDEDGTDLWPSDEWVSGEGISVSSANIISLEREGGPVTAIAELDDRLIIFKRQSLYQLVGSGPAASGDGNFDQPGRVTATVGTVIPESVVKTPQGLMFQSLRGFYLLPIGGGLPIRLRGVEALENITTTGSVLLESVEQVRFVCSTGSTLVYHFGFLDQAGVGRWSVHNSQFAVDCVVFGGRFCYLTSTGFVLEEIPGTWSDNGVGYGQVVQWAHLNLAGMFGRCKLYDVLVNAQVLSATTLTALLAFNYDDAGANIPTETTPMTLTSASPMPLRLGPAQRRCTAVHVRLTETASTTEGVRLTGLALNVAAESGAHKAGAAF